MYWTLMRKKEKKERERRGEERERKEERQREEREGEVEKGKREERGQRGEREEKGERGRGGERNGYHVERPDYRKTFLCIPYVMTFNRVIQYMYCMYYIKL